MCACTLNTYGGLFATLARGHDNDSPRLWRFVLSVEAPTGVAIMFLLSKDRIGRLINECVLSPALWKSEIPYQLS